MILPIKTAAELIDPELEARWTLRRADGQREMLRRIWRAFLVEGRPIPVDALERDLGDASPDSVRETLARLDAQDVIWVEDGIVRLAYPFSGDPTAFRVVLADGRVRIACCAIDALGIAPMLGQPITIRSRCHHCEAALQFAANPEGPSPDADGVMVWIGRRGAGERLVCTGL
jgi:hypothetical protein